LESPKTIFVIAAQWYRLKDDKRIDHYGGKLHSGNKGGRSYGEDEGYNFPARRATRKKGILAGWGGDEAKLGFRAFAKGRGNA
jgi:hypothetical protein